MSFSFSDSNPIFDTTLASADKVQIPWKFGRFLVELIGDHNKTRARFLVIVRPTRPPAECIKTKKPSKTEILEDDPTSLKPYQTESSVQSLDLDPAEDMDESEIEAEIEEESPEELAERARWEELKVFDPAAPVKTLSTAPPAAALAAQMGTPHVKGAPVTAKYSMPVTATPPSSEIDPLRPRSQSVNVSASGMPVALKQKPKQEAESTVIRSRGRSTSNVRPHAAVPDRSAQAPSIPSKYSGPSSEQPAEAYSPRPDIPSAYAAPPRGRSNTTGAPQRNAPSRPQSTHLTPGAPQSRSRSPSAHSHLSPLPSPRQRSSSGVDPYAPTHLSPHHESPARSPQRSPRHSPAVSPRHGRRSPNNQYPHPEGRRPSSQYEPSFSEVSPARHSQPPTEPYIPPPDFDTLDEF
eukprot:TRINITY_DN1296_c0_g1_i2.p1 TRINITY_DN1296_c0_g1~~TRINITY_DN1296_c0_g1_i2.p1  ORF type:complete len:408 (-),score=62.07 TRINITY_DN1296_c0_g1_i2:56-1279(-)